MDKGEDKGMIIIVSSPSGGGKTTIVNMLLEKMEGVKRSVSYTTREPRDGEIDKKDYCFVSEEEFKNGIETNDFLEWEKNFDHYYGTSVKQVREMIDEGIDVVLSIDVKGARAVRSQFPECISIFIMPPSIETLQQRLVKRDTEGEEELSKRLEESKKEIDSSEEYEYLVVNDKVEVAAIEIKSIIEKERESRKKRREKRAGTE